MVMFTFFGLDNPFGILMLPRNCYSVQLVNYSNSSMLPDSSSCSLLAET